MKKIIVLSLVVLFGLFQPVLANSTDDSLSKLDQAINSISQEGVLKYNNLNLEQKENRLIKISETYKTGDALTLEDSNFMLLSMDEERNTIKPMTGSSTKAVSVEKSSSGTSISMAGNMYQNIAYGAGTSTYRGYISLSRRSGTLSKVAIATHHSSYGLIGTAAPYVGCVYSGKVSMSKTSSLDYTLMDRSTQYNSVLPIYTIMYTQATITTGQGNVYTATSPTWTSYQ